MDKFIKSYIVVVNHIPVQFTDTESLNKFLIYNVSHSIRDFSLIDRNMDYVIFYGFKCVVVGIYYD